MGRLRNFAGVAATVAGVLVLLLAAGPSSGADRAGKRSCDTIRLGVVRVLYKHHVGCSTATRYARRLYKSDGEKWPRHYTCYSDSDYDEGGGCRHKSKDKYFGWHSID